MKVHELLAVREKWTQGTPARNKDGKAVDTYDPQACSFCLWGALKVCYPSKESESAFGQPSPEFLLAVEKVKAKLAPEKTIAWEPTIVFNWNDHHLRTHKEVLALCQELDI